MIDTKLYKAGDSILFTGEIFTARDAAHKRMTEFLNENKPLPFKVKNRIVYYAGPCPAPPKKIIGSIGPTTSTRMDIYAPRLIKEGLRVMIGKGNRTKPVIDAIKKYNGLYLAAVGGAGALLSQCVEKSELIAFEDLGTEAIYKLTVKDMPLMVAIDSYGGNIYELR